jgi:hypothetical protein
MTDRLRRFMVIYCQRRGWRPDDVMHAKTRGDDAHRRAELWWQCRQIRYIGTNLPPSFPEIAAASGRLAPDSTPNHSTVLAACRRYAELVREGTRPPVPRHTVEAWWEEAREQFVAADQQTQRSAAAGPFNAMRLETLRRSPHETTSREILKLIDHRERLIAASKAAIVRFEVGGRSGDAAELLRDVLIGTSLERGS